MLATHLASTYYLFIPLFIYLRCNEFSYYVQGIILGDQDTEVTKRKSSPSTEAHILVGRADG